MQDDRQPSFRQALKTHFRKRLLHALHICYIYSRLVRYLAITLLLTLAPNLSRAQTLPTTQPYIWKSVQMSGGGFVDGIIFHPRDKNICYARTDIGGAYRRDPQTGTWIPLLDWLSHDDTNLI